MSLLIHKLAWFVKVKEASEPETLGLLFNGSETLVIGGPTGTHLGGHNEKGLAYRDTKLVWVREQGFIEATRARSEGLLPASWFPPGLSRSEKRLVRALEDGQDPQDRRRSSPSRHDGFTWVKRLLLAARAAFFLVVFPGTVTVYIPYRLLRSAGRLGTPDFNLISAAAGLVMIAGVAVLLACVWQFAAKGHGTLAPVDPPRRLVISGLYRFTRNPMYHGVLTLLLGEAWLFSSLTLLEYAAGIFVMFHCFVVLYEEHALESKFGEAYIAYRRAVPRWGFTVYPYPRDPAGVES